MNENIELVEKSLETISPEWNVMLVASITEDGFEYDLFSKGANEEVVALLAMVNTVTLAELKERT
jgi:hypothetical protein